MTIEEQLSIIKELEASKGWAIIRHYMEKSLLDAAMQMAEGAPMQPEQFNFHRGAMWAAKKTIDLPSSLRTKLETELVLSSKDNAEKLSRKVSLRPDIEKKETN